MPFNRLDNLLSKGRGDWIILVFSLFLAFFLWSILKLSGEYSSYFDYKLAVKTNLPGRTEQAVSLDAVIVRGKSTGFYILQQRYSANAEIIPLTLDPRLLSSVPHNPDLFYTVSGNIRHLVQEALGNDFQLESITTDTIYFTFPRESYKKVPVAARSNISYKAQYMPFGRITVKPDSVIIYGQTDLLEAVDSVYTEMIRHSKADASLQGVVSLVPLEGIRFSDKEVFYFQEAGRYFETSLTVPLTAVNVPEGMPVILLPSEVTLTYRQHFVDKRELTPADFQAVINYPDIGESTDMVRVGIRKAPEGIFSLRMEPVFIKCFVN